MWYDHFSFEWLITTSSRAARRRTKIVLQLTGGGTCALDLKHRLSSSEEARATRRAPIKTEMETGLWYGSGSRLPKGEFIMRVAVNHTSRRSAWPLLIFAVLGLIAFSGEAYGQGFGRIVGTVTDASGALVPNAKVTATQVGKPCELR